MGSRCSAHRVGKRENNKSDQKKEDAPTKEESQGNSSPLIQPYLQGVGNIVKETGEEPLCRHGEEISWKNDCSENSSAHDYATAEVNTLR